MSESGERQSGWVRRGMLVLTLASTGGLVSSVVAFRLPSLAYAKRTAEDKLSVVFCQPSYAVRRRCRVFCFHTRNLST